MPRPPHKRHHMIAIAILPVLIAACAPLPDFPAGDAANAPYPKIVPVSQIQAGLPAAPAGQGIDQLAARAAALRARAAELRRASVVDRQTRRDMQTALNTGQQTGQ